MPLKIVPCSNWGKDQPRFVTKTVEPSSYLFFVNSNTRPCFDGFACIGQAKYIQRLHTRPGNVPDVRYNFMIGGDGVIYEGRGWMVLPSIPKRFFSVSKKSISIAFIGAFLETVPPMVMYDAREELILFGIQNGYIAKKHQQITLPSVHPKEGFR